ncbi:hypothetical protein DJ79_10255 [Halorubrum ezzemoulense]|uniref:PepSY domain-containing protein n=1 Tax=Halorubrum ezzemoulense TaxID=337243 RepID=A0A256K3M9_HALEZ|nr:PepSY domain-containing protein [Halorubrum ezzemoulense]OYR67138.1 hypothetical protein DJ79_10255 [Halorubrum ezzemoulense]OYR75483.1 hypothetical protein DJ76_02425 [Halorubrum ezzemoulense]
MKSNSRKIIGGAVVAIALLAVVGSGVAFAQGSGSSLVSDADDDDSIPESNVTLSEQEAIDIATAEANGTVNEVELENEDGVPVYEIKLVTTSGSETEAAVHADDGTVLETESEDEEMDEDSISESNVSLTEQEAIDIATAEANGTVDEVELETEDGTPVYEVELVTANGSETEVAVHADDGTVLETESEADEDEREDDEDEREEEMDDEDEEADGEDEYEDSDDE